jgi:hypothetical protein
MMTRKTIAGVHRLAVWIMLLMVLAGSSANGQYKLSWYTIDGGGGRSSGGDFTLTGTIGQPDAAYSADGGYELLGGFWPGGPLCIVDFRDFARFAKWWLVTGTDLPADLYEDIDNIVNELDLRVFLDYWLCYCSTGWPLK